MQAPNQTPIVRYLDQTDPVACPYGDVRRVITGGDGGIANVHVVSVEKGLPHTHAAYAEVYYILSGTGMIELDGESHPLRPGAVVTVPAGVTHALEADEGTLEFIIFGTPPMFIDDPRARPLKPHEGEGRA